MASGQVLMNLIGSLSQPVAFLESSLQIIEITTSLVTAVRSKHGTSVSETYESGDTGEMGRYCTVLPVMDKKCILRSSASKLKLVGVSDFVPLDDM